MSAARTDLMVPGPHGPVRFILVVSDPQPVADRWAGELPMSLMGEPAQKVSVCPPGQGEVRGYWLADERLWLSLPCYTGEWREVDEALVRHFGRCLQPYTVGAGGVVVYGSGAA